MGVGEFAQMRASFFRLHPNTITPGFKLPHKKFMERLARDYLAHEAILPYKLGEIRLHSEAVVTKPQQLIKMSHVEEPAQISLEDDAMNCVYAFWTALEFGGHCGINFFKNGGTPDVSGGPMKIVKEVEERRRDTPGVEFIIKIAQHLRRRMSKLLTERSDDFPNVSAALWEIWRNEQHIWNEARTEALDEIRSRNLPARQHKPKDHRGKKRARSSSSSQSQSRSRVPRRTRGKRGAKSTKTRADKKSKKKDDRERRRSKSADDNRDTPGRKQEPADEWTALQRSKMAIARTCRFYNLSCGCSSAKCVCEHVCWT